MKREIYPQIQNFFRFFIALIRTSLLFRLELLTHSTNIWQFKLLIPDHFAKKTYSFGHWRFFSLGMGHKLAPTYSKRHLQHNGTHFISTSMAFYDIFASGCAEVTIFGGEKVTYVLRLLMLFWLCFNLHFLLFSYLCVAVPDWPPTRLAVS